MKREKKNLVDKHALIPTDVWEEYDEFLRATGLNFSTSVNIFIKQCIIRKQLPFDVITSASETENVSTETMSDIYQYEEVMEDMSALDVVKEGRSNDEEDDSESLSEDMLSDLSMELATVGLFDD